MKVSSVVHEDKSISRRPKIGLYNIVQQTHSGNIPESALLIFYVDYW